MKAYIADRDFNEVRKGERVEMDDDHPYLRTGYLIPEEDVEELAPEERPVVEEDLPEADADREAFEAEQEEEPAPKRRRASRKADSDADEGSSGA